MSKKKNLNTHKGKAVKDKIHRYNPPVRAKFKVRGGDFSYFAVDTNIILHFINVFEGRNALNTRVYSNLFKLVDNNIFGSGGRINRKGKFVMLLLPAVLEELKDKFGNIHPMIKEFIEDRMLIVGIKDEKCAEFNEKVQKIMQCYKKQGLFLEKNGKVGTDGKIMAQAAVLNLDILTQDHHFGVYETGKEKIELMKSIHKSVVDLKPTNPQAQPQDLNTFFTFYHQGKPVAQIENKIYLSDNTLKTLNDLKFIGQNPRARLSSQPSYTM